MAQKKVTIIGSGNWGSAIARIIGNTVVQHSTTFQTRVPMWVFEEMVDDKKLSEIIILNISTLSICLERNCQKTLLLFLIFLKLQRFDADILVFVVPHQFVEKLCNQLKGNVKSSAVAVSLIKGLSGKSTSSKLRLISEDISETLGIDAAVLMGRIWHLKWLMIILSNCGNLWGFEECVACAAGFSDGLGYGDNTKAAIIRLGLMEMMRFIEYFYPNTRIKLSLSLVVLLICNYLLWRKEPKTLYELEAELLKGQSAQGPLTAAELYDVIKTRDLLKMFPLFEAVHNICIGQVPVEEFIGKIRNHPEYEDRSNAEFH
uniref:Glycerol-3-phosphate dehydrogenase [NAD(+)] n=1 Tax=Meloidogyne enterolobii TaxID=390850 RepID=A0A6V7UE42_MELEN|nr:unnamed protein product [Meloidogyne enterolobii]